MTHYLKYSLRRKLHRSCKRNFYSIFHEFSSISSCKAFNKIFYVYSFKKIELCLFSHGFTFSLYFKYFTWNCRSNLEMMVPSRALTRIVFLFGQCISTSRAFHFRSSRTSEKLVEPTKHEHEHEPSQGPGSKKNKIVLMIVRLMMWKL